MRLSEQYTVERSQYDPAFRTINLRGSKNCGGRVVDLNADAIAAIESLKVPGQRMKGRVFPRERRAFKVTREKVSGKRTSTSAPGSTRRSNSPRSKASPGTATRAWLAMASVSTVEIKSQQGIAPSRWPLGIPTCHRNTPSQ
jgi:hypothetical protein